MDPIAALLVLAGYFHVKKNTLYRVTSAGVHVISPLGEKRYVIPEDAVLRPTSLRGGSLHVGEVPFEDRPRWGELVVRGTEPLTLTGLGAERATVERAVSEARTDEVLPSFAPRELRDEAERSFVAGREPLALDAFLAALPPEVPGHVARSVRGVVARACSLPVDFVRPAEELDALPGFVLCDAPALYFELVRASGERLEFATIDAALIRRGATVSDLAVAVSSSVRRGARRSP